MTSEITANKRRAALLLGGLVLASSLVALLVGLFLGHPWSGLLLGLVVGVVLAVGAQLTGPGLVLRSVGAQPVDAAAQPRLHNLVDGLCMAGGVARPALFVIDDHAPNALAVGRTPRHASIAVTTGLLDQLGRVELEGVVAHELVRIREGAVVPATLSVPILGYLLPVSAPLLRAVTAGDAETTDAAAVQLTRYPPGLVGALQKVGAAPPPAASTKRRLAHLWLEAPGERVDDRIAALREL